MLLIWPKFASMSKMNAPPLGLLKIAGYHRAQGDDVRLVRQVMPLLERCDGRPDRVYVSSLFTYDRDRVVAQVHAAFAAWPGVDVRLGGIWASLLPDEAQYLTGVEPHVGLWDLVEDVRPAWDLWPGDWSAGFASRGCVRTCPYCSVGRLDGPFRARPVDLVLSQLDLDRPGVDLWDNNILAHPDFEELCERLISLDKRVTIPQGVDATLLTGEQAGLLRRLRGRQVYLAYDQPSRAGAVERAISYLREAGHSHGHIIVYVLYNFYDAETGQGDTPEEIYQRIDDIIEWGGRAYPCRFRPIDRSMRLFISPRWGWEALKVFNDARGNLSKGAGVVYRSLREYKDWVDAGLPNKIA